MTMALSVRQFIASTNKPASGWQLAAIFVFMLLPLPLYILLPIGVVALLMFFLRYLDARRAFHPNDGVTDQESLRASENLDKNVGC